MEGSRCRHSRSLPCLQGQLPHVPSIRQTVDRLLPPLVRDADGNDEDRRGTVSVFNGPDPLIRVFGDRDREIEGLAHWVCESMEHDVESEEIGIFVRSIDELSRARAVVKQASQTPLELSERVEDRNGRISIGTMHLAKGLEFKAVAVMACDDDVLPLQCAFRGKAAVDSDLIRPPIPRQNGQSGWSCDRVRWVILTGAVGLSKRRIAVGLNIGRTAVGDYLRRARRAGLAWPLPDALSDEALERLLFAPPPAVSPDRRPLPDWPLMHRELKRPGVTLSLLWEEYRAVHRDGYGYSRFCDLYRDWRGRLAPTMRQTHVAGDKLFVDYAGATADVIDGLTGEVRTAQIFVATLGASSYTYAEATWTQALPDWIGSHSRAFAYFGGVPRQVVPDNLKSGVVKACLYDPEINRTYAGMAAHYDTAIVPTRPRKPRDGAVNLTKAGRS